MLHDPHRVSENLSVPAENPLTNCSSVNAIPIVAAQSPGRYADVYAIAVEPLAGASALVSSVVKSPSPSLGPEHLVHWPELHPEEIRPPPPAGSGSGSPQYADLVTDDFRLHRCLSPTEDF